MRFETYEEAEQWVLGRKSILVYYEPFARAMHMLGNPHNGLSYLHVAGTNGKGSTCRFLYDICRKQYPKVGLYTSPHLENIRDRIRINDQWIPEEVFLRYVNEHMDVIEACNLGMVGICSMMCFLWFQEEQVDLAILEVSMGGRYDTTNVIQNPLVSVITSISYDHMNFLGNTLQEIAGEKAGIIKENCPVVLGRLPEEADEVIAAYAETMHAPLKRFPESFSETEDGFVLEGIQYAIASDISYQKRNGAVALCAAREIGIDITSESVKESMRDSIWPGRYEVIQCHPKIILDGAHNPEGIEALCEASAAEAQPKIAVFSALKDKQGQKMRQQLEEAFDEVITTGFSHDRADSTDHLGGGCVIADWKDAIEAAVQKAGEHGTVIITGSLYFISAIRAFLKHPER